jgi:hypothetical protein
MKSEVYNSSYRNSDELLVKFMQANSIVIFYLQLQPNFINRSLYGFYYPAWIQVRVSVFGGYGYGDTAFYRKT